MDTSLIENIELSYDPISNFRNIYLNEYGGEISLPTFGGGTVRSEFEVLTGMNIDYLKQGEIPYNNVVRTSTVESLASIFNLYEYNTTAIHNYKGDFYNRNKVISNMGFNKFISMEDIENTDNTRGMEQDDSLLFDKIIKVLENDGLDFIYAINVGTHSPYRDDEFLIYNIEINGQLQDEYKNSLQSYLIKLNKLDKEIGRLVKYIDDFEEPVLLVMFSDHLPNLPILNDVNYYNEDKFSAPYAIYSNKELVNDLELGYIEAYELGTKILNTLGLEGGIMNKFHNEYKRILKAIITVWS